MAMSAESKKAKRDQEIVEEVLKEYQQLSGDRSNFESHWQEIAERVVPSHKNLFNAPPYSSISTKGEKRTEFLFDSTASIALNRFSAILDSLLTPRNQTWHRVMATEPKLMKDREVRLWFDEVNRVLFKNRYAPMANFASQNQQNYKSLGAYGTGCIFIDELFGDPGFRYRNVHLAEVFFAENHQGIVNRVLRYFPLTARQAMEKWPDTCPEKIRDEMKINPQREYFFLHCVKDRADYDPTRKDFMGMKFASYYVSVECQALLSEGGYNTFPYAVSRYEQTPGEIYGRSPAMDVLPAIKTLNEEKKTILKQGHRTVDPVLISHDDGIAGSFSFRPGAMNPGGVSKEGRPLVHTLPVGNIAIGKDLMDDERVVINDAFLVSLFQVLIESPQMTATEVLERSREKGILLAPTIGRQQSEYLGPLIEREIDLAARQGLLPPMPEALLEARGEYRIEYDSPLSRAQRAEEAAGLMRTVETTLGIVNVTQNQALLDNFNWDVIIPEVSEIQGVPARWMRSTQEIAMIRQGRAEQAETQEQIQAAPAVASMVKAVAPKG